MKKIILIFSIFVYCGYISAQQQEDYFSLSLKLVKHNGLLDDKAYFQATFKSNSERNLFIGSSKLTSFSNRGVFVIEKELSNGEIIRTNECPFFYSEEKIIQIPSKSSIVVKLPLFPLRTFTGDGEMPGFFEQTLEKTEKYKKFRIKLYDLFYGVRPRNRDEKRIGGTIPLITSNWVDISNEDISKAFK